MSAPERVSHATRDETHDESPTEPKPSVLQHSLTRRTTRRFEIGFFLRKVHFGRLAYYKEQVLLRRLKQEGEPAPVEPQPESVTPENEGVGAPKLMMARMEPASGESDDGVSVQGGAGMGSGDPGPIGGTRFEGGFFAETTTETTGDDAS